LDAIIIAINDIDVTVCIDSYILRPAKLTVPTPFTSPLQDELTGGSEFQHAMMALVYYVYEAVVVDIQGSRSTEFAITDAVMAPYRNEQTIGCELNDTAILSVSHKDAPTGIYSYPPWTVEIPWLRQRRPHMAKTERFLCGSSRKIHEKRGKRMD
jgi:hypothetical protein